MRRTPEGVDPQPEALRLDRCWTSDFLVSAAVPHPSFNVAEPVTTLALIASEEIPIQLRDIVQASQGSTDQVAGPRTHSFYLKSEASEKIQTASSLVFTSPLKFVAGTNNQLYTFDLNRPGLPVNCITTAPHRKYRKSFIYPGPLGTITALASAPSQTSDATRSILAAGTLHREVGLFPRAADEAAGMSLSISGDARRYGISGSGVTSCSWSPCGGYLYVAERNSDGILMYDVRNTRGCLGACIGRHAETNQRMGVDVIQTQDGHAVVAGGLDGVVRLWNNPDFRGRALVADEEWKMHDDAVSSAVIDPYGDVLATCSGQRQPFGGLEIDSSSSEDSASDEGSSDDSREVSTASREVTKDQIPDYSLKLWVFDK